jgi:hypothetical protein
MPAERLLGAPICVGGPLLAVLLKSLDDGFACPSLRDEEHFSRPLPTRRRRARRRAALSGPVVAGRRPRASGV